MGSILQKAALSYQLRQRHKRNCPGALGCAPGKNHAECGTRQRGIRHKSENHDENRVCPRRSSPSHFHTSGKTTLIAATRTNVRVAAIVRARNAAQPSLSIWREAAEEAVVLPIWSRGEVDGVRIPSIAPVSDSERP